MSLKCSQLLSVVKIACCPVLSADYLHFLLQVDYYTIYPTTLSTLNICKAARNSARIHKSRCYISYSLCILLLQDLEL
jgi:hypothetical protein